MNQELIFFFKTMALKISYYRVFSNFRKQEKKWSLNNVIASIEKKLTDLNWILT